MEVASSRATISAPMPDLFSREQYDTPYLAPAPYESSALRIVRSAAYLVGAAALGRRPASLVCQSPSSLIREGELRMDCTSTTAPAGSILHCALELSKNTWLLGIQFSDRPQTSLYPIRGGDTEDLMAKLAAARDRCAKVSGRAPSIVLCYEAGYDAFWLARFLKSRGIECRVIDSASMQVNRRARRSKTDRIDVGKLLRGLIAWLRGDRHVWSVVRIPSVDEEDLRRSHRERDYLVHERTAHINRIKGLLFAQGIRGINVKRQYKTLHIAKLVTGEGHPIPPRLASEIVREIARLTLV
jgi:transposase